MGFRRVDKALNGLPPAEHFLEQLDLEKVADEILATENGRPLSEEDFVDAKNLIWEAAGRWLVSDILDLTIDGIEDVREVRYNGVRVKGVIDLSGTVNGRLNATSNWAGRRKLIDWKTTHNATLDSKWKDKHRDSWQWGIYSHILDSADVFEYRGISRSGEMASVVIETSEETKSRVRNHLDALFHQRQALISGNFPIWPQNKPHACGAYGRECPYLNSCPGEPAAVKEDKSFSHSGMGLFMLCPERYRRSIFDEGEGESSDDSKFGQAVHRGMAELYRQVKEKDFGKQTS